MTSCTSRAVLCCILFKYAKLYATPCDILCKLLLVLLCIFEINLSEITTLTVKPLFRLNIPRAALIPAVISRAAARASPTCRSLDPEVTSMGVMRHGSRSCSRSLPVRAIRGRGFNGKLGLQTHVPEEPTVIHSQRTIHSPHRAKLDSGQQSAIQQLNSSVKCHKASGLRKKYQCYNVKN